MLITSTSGALAFGTFDLERVEVGAAHVTGDVLAREAGRVEAADVGLRLLGRPADVRGEDDVVETAQGGDERVPLHLRLDREDVQGRPGDVAQCLADPRQAKALLNWETQFDLDRMCADAWRWQSMNPQGFDTPL